MMGSKFVLFASLMTLLQVSQALPQATRVQPRADESPQQTPSGVGQWTADYFGPQGSPQITDLEEASVLANHVGSWKGVSAYPVILLGFLKCNPGWVESWFPKREETTNPDYTDMPAGEGYVLTYMWNFPNNERIAQPVKYTSLDPVTGHKSEDGTIKGGIVADFYPENGEGDSWWPWALLKGALVNKFNSNDGAINLDEITLAISAMKVVQEDERDPEKLWTDVFAKTDSTPSWMETKDDFWVAMTPIESEKGRSVTFSRFKDGKKFDEEWTIDDIIKGATRITHLEGLPFFDGTRTGKWESKALEAPGTSMADRPYIATIA